MASRNLLRRRSEERKVLHYRVDYMRLCWSNETTYDQQFVLIFESLNRVQVETTVM